MDTKLKSKLRVGFWFLLFTVGLSGTLSILTQSYYGVGQGTVEGRQIIYIVGSATAFVLSLALLKRVEVASALRSSLWNQYYSVIPIDIRFITVVLTGLLTLNRLTQVGPALRLDVLGYARNELIGTIFVVLMALQVHSLGQIVADQKQLRTAWRDSVMVKVQTLIREAFLHQATGMQVTVLAVIAFASGFGLMVVFMAPQAVVLYAPLFLIVTLPALIVLYRNVGNLNRIIYNTTELVQGRVEPDLPIRGQFGLKTLATNVNTMKQGVESSQAAQARSERLKTELITNVSHDLRTPLTSIITYSKLLKDPNLSATQLASYVDIIDKKSQRLRVLIDDLFEASKMASGNIELNLEQIDITQLLQQTLAENDEDIKQSTLQFRITQPDTPVSTVVDGQKLWRVFDNLLRNILKYSLEHTRVYISVQTVRNNVVVTFKNIAKYELCESIDELFERFKRGDTSRHTEGSGLGLAIAKSIVDLHNGSLDLAIDGDLFKATVTLPASSN